MNNFSTLFSDVDGTLLYSLEKWSLKDIEKIVHANAPLPGVIDKLTDWRNRGNLIVLTTARPHILKSFTENELKRLKIPFDYLMMGMGTGDRKIMNNYGINSTIPTAYAINVAANKGLEDITI